MDHDHSKTGGKAGPETGLGKKSDTTAQGMHDGAGTTTRGATDSGRTTTESSKTGSAAGGAIGAGKQTDSGRQASSGQTGSSSKTGSGIGQTGSGKRYAEDTKESVADKLAHNADAAEDAARGFDDQGQETLSRYTGRLADSMNSVSNSLRQKSVGQMGRDVARFARENPTAMVLGSVAVGFVLSRFMKASSRHDSGHPHADTRVSGAWTRDSGRDSATGTDRESYTTGELAEDSRIPSSRPAGGDAVGLTTTAPTSPTRPSTPGKGSSTTPGSY